MRSNPSNNKNDDSDVFLAEEPSYPRLMRTVLALALPMMIGAGVQTSYHLINMFWVGKLGADGLAVLSLFFPIYLLMVSLGSGLALAASILVAQYFGARDRVGVNHLVTQSLIMMVGLAALLTLLGQLLSPAILHLLGTPERLVDDAIGYARISFLGIPFLFVSSYFQSVLRGLGEPQAPLRIVLCSVLLNAALDPLLIFGAGPVPGLGVHGAAIATVVTQVITAFFGLRMMLGERFGLALEPLHLRQDWPLIGRLFKIGMPASIEQSMGALYVSVMTVLVSQFGAVALAAYGIAFRILTFAIIPAFCISMATSILVGQRIGAGRRDQTARVASVSALTGLLVMGTFSLFVLLMAEQIATVFTSGDAGLVDHAKHALWIFALSFPISAVQFALMGAFRGAGDTFSTMLMTLIGTWAIQLPLALVLSRTSLGESGLWWSGTAASTVNLCVAITYFRLGRWNRVKLIEPAPA